MAEKVTYTQVSGQAHSWRRDGATFGVRWNRLLWQWVIVVEFRGWRAVGNGRAAVDGASIRHIGDGVFECKM